MGNCVQYDVPIVLIFFNKLETTKRVFNAIKKIQPQKLYLISDGGRDENEKSVVLTLREWVERNIDWPIEVEKVYSDINMGLRKRMVTGLSYVFEKEEMAIILEDDCLPLESFFEFSREMLYRYRENPEVMVISGQNIVPYNKYRISNSYTFSCFAHCWGWASWRRFWKLYDEKVSDWPEVKEKKIIQNQYGEFGKYLSVDYDELYQANGEVNYWTGAWQYAIFKNGGLCIVPRYNLVVNLGWGIEEAVHTKANLPSGLKKIFKKSKNLTYPYLHPQKIEQDKQYDLVHLNTNILEGNREKAINFAFEIKERLKGYFYRKQK